MSGEYITKIAIGNEGNKKVLIVKGGWSCNAGYIVWSYVAIDNQSNYGYAKTQYDKYICRIGDKIFESESKLGGSEYADKILSDCIKFIKDNEYFCDTIVTMRTD